MERCQLDPFIYLSAETIPGQARPVASKDGDGDPPLGVEPSGSYRQGKVVKSFLSLIPVSTSSFVADD